MGFEEDYPGWEQQIFIDPFKGRAEKKQATEACADLASYLVGELAGILNDRHCRNYSHEYWWTLLIRWLLILVPGLWRRWVNISNVSQKLGHSSLT